MFIVWGRALDFPRGTLNVDDSMANSGHFSVEPSFMLVMSTQECSDKAWGQSGAYLSDVGRALGALILNGCHGVLEVGKRRPADYVAGSEGTAQRSRSCDGRISYTGRGS